MNLFPHQENAIARIALGLPTYVAFDMGLGKTRTFLEAVKRAGAQRVLIICPASAILVWKAEIARWLPGASYTVVRKADDVFSEARFLIVSHGLFSQVGQAIPAALLQASPFDMAALDEAQAFSAPGSLRVKALRRMTAKLGLIVPLSGTPIRNHAGELYNMLSLVWPDGLKTPMGTNRTRTDFENEFCKVTMRPFARGRPPVRSIEGSRNVPRLRALVAPFMVRVRKEEVLADLPPILWDRVQIPLDETHFPPKDAATMAAIVQDMAKSSDSDDALLAALSAQGPGHLMQLRRLLGLAKLKGAKEYITDLLDALPDDRKVLVFAVHADVISSLAHHLGEFDPAVLTGATSAQARQVAVTRFLSQASCRVFIGNIQAAGTAITLVGPKCKCSDVVFVESSWTPADNAQAACRVHRIGQRDGVTARMLSAAGTIDDLIQALLTRKASDFTQLFDQGAIP